MKKKIAKIGVIAVLALALILSSFGALNLDETLAKELDVGVANDKITAQAAESPAWNGAKDIATGFACGDGSETNPYLIATGAELAYLAQQVEGVANYSLDKFFKLTADIALNAGTIDSPSDTANPWTPIGINSGTNSFNGTFDGQGHTVSGIYINGDGSHMGLFGYVKSGVVKNVGVINSYIKGNNDNGDACVGGVVGQNDGRVTNCNNSGTVTGTSANNYVNVGGVVGYNGAILTNCNNSGTVTGTSASNAYVGGVIGGNGQNSVATNCYNTGIVNGTCAESAYVGGVVGYNFQGAVVNCYNTNEVKGATTRTSYCETYVGGVVGNNLEQSIALNSYNTGKVTGTANYGTPKVGGVVGNSSGTSKVANCYFLTEKITINGTAQTAENERAVGNGNNVVTNCSAFDSANKTLLKAGADEPDGSGVAPDRRNGVLVTFKANAPLVDTLNAGKNKYNKINEFYIEQGTKFTAKAWSVSAGTNPVNDGCPVFMVATVQIGSGAETNNATFKEAWETAMKASTSENSRATVKLFENITATADGTYGTTFGITHSGASYAYIPVASGNYITLDLGGKTINRNLSTAQNMGYVINIASGGNLAINDSVGTGKITGGNNSDNNGGGGIYNVGVFTMNGGAITGNTANNGGGVYVNGSSGTLNLSGDAKITGNTKGGTANNIYLPSGKVINISDGNNSTASDAFTGVIGVTLETYTGLPLVITSGWGSTELGAGEGHATVNADDAKYKIEKVSTELELNENLKRITFLETQQEFDYSKSGKSFELKNVTDGLADGFTITYKKNSNPTDPYVETLPIEAGDYDVKITRAKNAPYQGVDKVISKGLYIKPKTVTLKWTAPSDLVYDGTAKKPIVVVDGVESGDTCDVNNLAVTSGKDNINVTDNGFDFTVTTYQLSNFNYTLASNAVSNIYKITAKPITAATASKVYDGNADFTNVAISSNDIISGDNITATFTTLRADKGEYKGSESGKITNLVKYNDNYSFGVADITAIIKGKALPDITLDINSVIYDGGKHEAKVQSFSDLKPTKDFILTWKYSANVNESNEDNFTTLIIGKNNFKYSGTYKVTATGRSNYADSTKSAKYVIEKKEVNLKWTAPSDLVYDGQAKVATVVADNLVGDDTCAVTSAVTAKKNNVDVGSFTFKATDISNSNYKLPANVVSDSYTITKATNTWITELSIPDITEGEALAPKATAKFGEVVFTYYKDTDVAKGDALAQAPAAVGKYFVTAQVAETNNYTELTETTAVECEIKAKPTYGGSSVDGITINGEDIFWTGIVAKIRNTDDNPISAISKYDKMPRSIILALQKTAKTLNLTMPKGDITITSEMVKNVDIGTQTYFTYDELAKLIKEKDPTPTEKPTEPVVTEKPTANLTWLWILLAIIIVATIVAVVIIKKKK